MSDDGDKGRKLPHLDRDGIDGEDPMGERRADESDAAVTDCEIQAHERSGPAHESHYEAVNELDEAFPIEALATPIGDDGLPDHSVDDVSQGTHPFTYETMCCVADARRYVELFVGEVTDYDEPPLPRQRGLRRDGDGHYFRRGLNYALPLVVRHPFDKQTGEPAERQSFDPSLVRQRWGLHVVASQERRGMYIPVRPQRDACVYYQRQHFGNDDQPVPTEPGHNVFFRLCTHPSRRSIGGAAMSLRDEAIYGCDFRHPPHPDGLAYLDEHDANKLRQRPDLIRLPLFGGPGDIVQNTPES